MSLEASQYSPLNFLELPRTWLAHLVQHVASNPGGLASAAALSQTCKSFYALSDSSAVMYRNLHLDNPVDSLDHPFFRWLAKRHRRVAGLTAELRLLTVDSPEPGPEQLQLMFSIPGLHLTLRYNTEVTAPDDLFVTKVLRPHAHLIDHLTSIVHIKAGGLELQDFCEAAAPCRSLDLTVGGHSQGPLNVGALNPVADSLVQLSLKGSAMFVRQLESVGSLSSLSQLTSLNLEDVEFVAEEPWIFLGGLTNLKQLSLWVAAPGDPSPLSALTKLSFLALASYDEELHPYTFSSLQPLSTMQQLKELELHGEACSATSLNGLAELSRLETFRLGGPMLRSLGGASSTGLTSLTIDDAPQLVSLAGIEHLQGLQEPMVRNSGVTTLEQLSGIESLTTLQQLVVCDCWVTSLQPIGQLVGGLKKLYVRGCPSVQEVVLELPHVQPTSAVIIEYSNVKEVVLAGGSGGW